MTEALELNGSELDGYYLSVDEARPSLRVEMVGSVEAEGTVEIEVEDQDGEGVAVMVAEDEEEVAEVVAALPLGKVL